MADELTAKQESAILALLSSPSVEAAAKACKVGKTTLFAWLNEPYFKAAYRSARRSVLETALASINGVVGDAVAALKRNLTCEVPAAEVRAAVAVLDMAIAAQGMADLAAEVEELNTELVVCHSWIDGRPPAGYSYREHREESHADQAIRRHPVAR